MREKHHGRSRKMTKIVIFGAGAIGCYVGGHWAAATMGTETSITLIGRGRTFDGFRNEKLRLSGGRTVEVKPGLVNLSTQASDFSSADMIILAMKSTALPDAIAELERHAAPETPIVSLLNGIEPARRLKAVFPERQIIAGMVPFNVVWQSKAHLHRSSAGSLALEQTVATQALADKFEASGVPITLHDDLAPVQHGKLLLNLANPINALSGISLHKMLSQRAYREIYSAVLTEALQVYDAAGITWQKVGPISPKLGQRLLRLPDWLFNATLLKLQKIDRDSMTSMASDVAACRETEIDMLNGEIVRMAREAGIGTPLNARLVDMIHALDGPVTMSARELRQRIGL